jgi:phage I-like protein
METATFYLAEGNMMRSGQMNTKCMDEVWEVVQELPGDAREIWSQAFEEALLEVQGDMGKAAAMAWQAFKRQDQKVGSVPAREKAAKGLLLVAIYGGTPEWIRLVKNDGLVIDDSRCPCLVDRRALDALVAKWEQWDEDLVVLLEDHQTGGRSIPVVGWIKEIKCRADELWVRVEWTEEGLGYIARKEFGYLGLGFILDEGNRPVELWQARLTNYPVLTQWQEELGHLRVQKRSHTEADRRLRLIKGVAKQDKNGAGESRVDANAGTGPKKEETSEVSQFLDDMRKLLHMRGEVSLGTIKRAIVEFQAQQESRRTLGSEPEMRQVFQKVIGKTIEEAIQKGLIKPEQRSWAEVYATRDWPGFNEFLVLAAAVPQEKKGLFPYCRSLLRWVLAKPQETGSTGYKINFR